MSETTIVITPRASSTRVEVRDPLAPKQWLLRAELAPEPSHPRAAQWLIEALALWQGSPIHAVLVAEDPGAIYVSRLYPAWFTDFGGALYTLELRSAPPVHVRRRERQSGERP